MSGRAEGLAVVAGAVALAFGMTYPLASGLERLGRFDSGDGQFSVWVVAWVARTLASDPFRVFDANIFYPHSGTLAYSEANLAAGILGIPAYWATGNPVFTHNVVVLLSIVLSAIGTYCLVRYLTGYRPAAAVAAVLFSCCSNVFAHLPHIQLLMTAALPFTLLAFHRVVDNPRPGASAALGMALLVAGLSCGYYGVYAAMAVTIGGGYYLVARGYWRRGDYVVALASAAALSAVAISPVLYYYISVPKPWGAFRQPDMVGEWSANWAAYFAAVGLGNRWLNGLISDWKDVLFPGFVTLVLACGGVWAAIHAPRRSAGAAMEGEPGSDRLRTTGLDRLRETVGFYLLLAGLFLWMSFGLAAGPYGIMYDHVPFMSYLRAPVRFGLMVTLCLAVVGGVGLAAWLRHRPRGWVAALAVGVAAVIELTPVPLRLSELPPLPPAYNLLAALPDGAVAEFPFYYRPIDFYRHAEYMLNSTSHWKPLLNGYSDHFPYRFRKLAEALNQFPTEEGFRVLRASRTRYVVFHKRLYDGPSYASLMKRIARYRDRLRPLLTDGAVMLFELTGPSTP